VAETSEKLQAERGADPARLKRPALSKRPWIPPSGLFDRLPGLTLILGHLGETLPFFAWRIQHCFEYNPSDKRPERRLQDYLAENFYVSTSGNFNDQALITAILTIGADRILFAVDYPYEAPEPAADWIERAPISENDRRKIAHLNARALFGLPASRR
jgi:2,3-dihydroxybenzoate decarboxylase